MIATETRLTPRQRQVAHALVSSMSNKEIALRLRVRERTVKFHVACILARLGARNRTEAAVFAVQRGLAAHD